VESRKHLGDQLGGLCVRDQHDQHIDCDAHHHENVVRLDVARDRVHHDGDIECEHFDFGVAVAGDVEVDASELGGDRGGGALRAQLSLPVAVGGQVALECAYGVRHGRGGLPAAQPTLQPDPAEHRGRAQRQVAGRGLHEFESGPHGGAGAAHLGLKRVGREDPHLTRAHRIESTPAARGRAAQAFDRPPYPRPAALHRRALGRPGNPFQPQVQTPRGRRRNPFRAHRTQSRGVHPHRRVGHKSLERQGNDSGNKVRGGVGHRE